MSKYALARPISDNKAALKAKFPGAAYKGDVGDEAHLTGAGDHTWYSRDVIFGQKMRFGTVYAQDIGGGKGFAVPEFARYALDSVRAGLYPEIKYLITRHPDNWGKAGGRYFGLFDRRYSWRTQKSSGHSDYVHVSYMPGYEARDSSLVEDYWKLLNGITAAPAAKPDPAWRRWSQAPALPRTPLGKFSMRTLDRLPYSVYPPMVLGYGGPEAPQAQRDMARALLGYAIQTCRTLMVSQAEAERQEFGPGFLEWAHMLTTIKAANPWANDPARNGRAFGASIGAPRTW